MYDIESQRERWSHGRSRLYHAELLYSNPVVYGSRRGGTAVQIENDRLHDRVMTEDYMLSVSFGKIGRPNSFHLLV